jgi:hypothetical protein
LEAEIVTLRKEFQNKNMQNSSKVLDKIISSQRTNHDNFRLRYNHTEKGSISKSIDQETQIRIYAEIKGDKNFYKEDHKDTPPPRRFKF